MYKKHIHTADSTIGMRRVRERGTRVSRVLADSVKADSPANGRPVFRGELSFERAERSTWRIRRGVNVESRIFPASRACTDYLNLRERHVAHRLRYDRIMKMKSH